MGYSSFDDEIEQASFAVYVTDLSKNSASLQNLNLTNPNEPAHKRELPIAEFCTVLDELNVPGPCFSYNEKDVIASGAQFVVRQATVGFEHRPLPVLDAAVKSPKFMLDAQERLNLATESVRRQVYDLLFEVAALCHPRLRRHDNIVDIIGWGLNATWHQVPFIALELADGDLGDFIGASEYLPFETRRQMIEDVASGLSALHGLGIVHGDIKPGNVLVFRTETRLIAKLSDFGGSAGLTGMALLRGRGTVGWRAPELRRYHDHGDPLDQNLLEKMDVYSFGLLAWFILSLLRFPRRGGEEDEGTLEAELSGLQHQYDIPRSLVTVYQSSIRACLCKKPDNRPADLMTTFPDDKQPNVDLNTITKHTESATSHEDINDNYEYDLPLTEPSNPKQGNAWIPGVNTGLLDHLRSAFLEDPNQLSSEMVFELFLDHHNFSFSALNDRATIELTYRYLLTAARAELLKAQALLFSFFEYHDVTPDKDMESNRRYCMFGCIASGGIAFSATARSIDPTLLDDGLLKFRQNGGFNAHYKEMRPEVLEKYIDLDLEAIRPGVTINKPLNHHGDYLLHILCSFQHPATLHILKSITTPENVNDVNEYAELPLYRACLCGASETVLFLLDQGGDPTFSPTIAWPSCLHWLVVFHPDSMDEVADKLVEKGAQVNEMSFRTIQMGHYPYAFPSGSPLHWAVEFSSVEAVQALLRHGADPWLSNGTRQFIFATMSPDSKPQSTEDIYHDEWILGPSKGPTAVEVAIQNWDYTVLALLLGHAPERTERNVGDGIGLFQHLIAAEFRWISDTSRFYNPLIRGSRNTRRKKIQRTIGTLIKYGFDVNSLSPAWARRGQQQGVTSTALMLAIYMGNMDVAEALIDAGADVNLAGNDGRTAIMYLGAKYAPMVLDHYDLHKDLQIQVTRFLLVKGARIDVRDNAGQSPILVLAQDGLIGAVEVLLQHGAVANDRVNPGNSLGMKEFPIFTLLSRYSGNTENFTLHRDREIAALLREYVVPLLPQTTLANASPTHETLLRSLAWNGLFKSGAVLLAGGVNVNPVFAANYIPGVEASECRKTPLDEVMSRYPLIESPQGRLSKSEAAKLTARFRRMEELLRKYDGRLAEDLDGATD
ncbi:hypothetical protein EDB81DRAFT_791550 [Dactylonectria macrodidyma]|uniref:Protein kinase domain-containing protein n=1 Tax=Dactylonectria macrodidyma TaxID=307937 RepID=A0A9P9F4K5_9HYPO|nr:hypothetical protein EDB81DRAFT_791550 [Dactylonectria macrodidyma]